MFRRDGIAGPCGEHCCAEEVPSPQSLSDMVKLEAWLLTHGYPKIDPDKGLSRTGKPYFENRVRAGSRPISQQG